jgi:NADP-dependent 3-hydroxy acid dehydrogenase YdfG
VSGALAGRRALVTGGSRGIGLATARLLAVAGARVAVIGRDADRLAGALRGIGPLASAIAADLARPDDVARALAEAHAALGDHPDILVSNAGAFPLAALADTDPDDFARTMELNLVAPFRLVHALLPHLRARGTGHVVTVGSVADRQVFPANGAYAASKFGARAMHEVLRLELRGSGVRATLVSPGPVDTALWDAIDPDARPGFTPRRDMLDAESVADAILFALTRPPTVNVDELRLSRS